MIREVETVPYEPTTEMLNAVEDQFPRSARWAVIKIWKIMVEATPPFLANDYGLSPEIVAWRRRKDGHMDGWTLMDREENAKEYEAMGYVVEPLYAHVSAAS